MRLVRVENLQAGLVVGRPVLDDKGQALLNVNVVLTERYIEALTQKGYECVYVKDADSPVDVPPDEDLDPATRIQAIQALRDTFDGIEQEVTELRGASFDELLEACRSDNFRALMTGSSEDVQGAVEGIIGKTLTRSTLAGMASIRSADSYLHNHCIDVCVIGITIGRTLGLDERRLSQLATGCLLHDIGKVFLTKHTDAMTEVRQHALLGFELLKNSPEPDILAPYVALEHHEHQDGSGQPRGLTGNNSVERDRKASDEPVPTLIGEIAAVANAYENLLGGRPGKPPQPPDHAIQAIRNASGTHLNRAIVRAFLRTVPVYPLGTEVLVRSTKFRNYTGIVTRVNQERLDRPTVMLIRDNTGKAIEPVEVNLLEHMAIQVRCRAN